jgi:hypothetical protein
MKRGETEKQGPIYFLLLDDPDEPLLSVRGTTTTAMQDALAAAFSISTMNPSARNRSVLFVARCK